MFFTTAFKDIITSCAVNLVGENVDSNPVKYRLLLQVEETCHYNKSVYRADDSNRRLISYDCLIYKVIRCLKYRKGLLHLKKCRLNNRQHTSCFSTLIYYIRNNIRILMCTIFFYIWIDIFQRSSSQRLMMTISTDSLSDKI